MAPSTGTLIHLVARDGKQDEVAAILGEAIAGVARDALTTTWYAYRITDTEFGVLETSAVDLADRDSQDHPVLGRLTDAHLASSPRVERFGVVAAKV
ncbi:hypothetical protein [Arthrobacter sp. SLBN-53]|uniref:hypothetical protein n=1 Tax=Arthrobacter sp. SLBN-53 TaxID=2768412 RepID=UPI00115455C9|nr:hypothetical protein [Arthrobacter sp. SLBN-53]TQK29899.1 hypothetical protein FBY28_2910 [Arthrobacter sp. SLBN-53]